MVFVMDQGADGLYSIVIKLNVPVSTGLLPLATHGSRPELCGNDEYMVIRWIEVPCCEIPLASIRFR